MRLPKDVASDYLALVTNQRKCSTELRIQIVKGNNQVGGFISFTRRAIQPAPAN